MSTREDICNLALSHLGHGVEVEDLDTDNTAAATALRRVYDNTLKNVLRDFDWPCTTTFLTLTQTDEDPTTEWHYSYSVPSDCLKVRRLLSGFRNPNYQQRIPFRIVRGEIFTDLDAAVAELTSHLVTKNGNILEISAPDADGVSTLTSDPGSAEFTELDVGRYMVIAGSDDSDNDGRHLIVAYNDTDSVDIQNDDGAVTTSDAGTWAIDESDRMTPDLEYAFSLRLAWAVSPFITGGDNSPLTQRIFEMYRMAVAAAMANAGNENQGDLPHEAEMIRARE